MRALGMVTMHRTLPCLLLIVGLVGCDASPQPLGGPVYVTTNRAPNGGALGISFNPTPPQTPGVVVSSVIAGGPADVAGILPGDLLMAIDGAALVSHDSLRQQAQHWKPGQTVRVNFRRGEEELAADIELMGSDELAELIQRDPVANQRPGE